jgi:tetratricopeptide (TPR) repeat protein
MTPRQEADAATTQAAAKLEREKDFKGGVELALQATAADPSDPRAWYWLGMGYFYEHRYPESIAALKKALELGTAGNQYWSACNTLAQCYVHESNDADLKSLLVGLSKVPPTTAYAFNQQGLLYLSVNSIGPAIEAFRHAAARSPKDQKIAENLAVALGRIDSVYTEQFHRNPNFDLLLRAKESAAEVGRWRNRTLIEAQDQLLPKLLRDSKTPELAALATKIEQTILDLAHENELAKDRAELAIANNSTGAAEVDELALIYRERIALLKPILATIKDEIANRQK